MPATFVPTRTQLILGLCIPVAVLVGYVLASPSDLSSLAIFALVFGTLAFPIALRFHHPLLILSWNAAVILNFLPGGPPLWMLLAFISFVIFLLDRSIRERSPVNHVPSVSLALIALLGVVLATAALTGGMGIASLGGASYGGKGYFFILGSVLGYLAIASHRLQPEEAPLYCAMFFLAGLSALIPNLIYVSGEAFWWLYYLFPSQYALEQARGDWTIDVQMVRIYGFGPASLALLSWLLAHYGFRGIFVWQRPWRMGLFLTALAAALYSGFRSFLILAALVCVLQFFLERVHRTRVVWAIAGLVLLTVPILIARPQSLPLVVQRSLSFLPLDINPVAKASAQMSTEWRLEMWRSVLPEVPRHLLLGKGYVIDPNELTMAIESAHRGYGVARGAAAAGDYHNGPLSVLIPFGLWGAAAFLWFLWASLLYLYRNYRTGAPHLRRINTLLLSLFAAKAVFFLLVFGMFYVDLPVFAGLVGFAVCLNGRPKRSVRREPTRPGGTGRQLPAEGSEHPVRTLNGGAQS